MIKMILCFVFNEFNALLKCIEFNDLNDFSKLELMLSVIKMVLCIETNGFNDFVY